MFLFEEEGDFSKGAFILVDKPLHWTSFDVVNKIRGALPRYNGKRIKVGHAGTLDPLATGLVIVCIGKWTKRIEYYMAKEKEYIADIRFGATTPSYDMETEPDNFYSYDNISEEKLKVILSNNFEGDIEQTPPVFSAIRVGGKRAYNIAREGGTVEISKRIVNIENIEILECNLPDIKLRIKCSKGTYIRSIAHDLGVKSGSGAYLSGLRRTCIGNYNVENAYKIEDIVLYLQNYL